jgi:hypothetical protein
MCVYLLWHECVTDKNDIPLPLLKVWRGRARLIIAALGNSSQGPHFGPHFGDVGRADLAPRLCGKISNQPRKAGDERGTPQALLVLKE